MVFNHKKNWTFRRFIKSDDNPGMKIFHKVARSMENRFKSNEPAFDNPVWMSDLSVSMDSLNSHSKTNSEPMKRDKTVQFDMNLKNCPVNQRDQYLELCKVKIYVTPSVEKATIQVHDDQKQKSDFKASEDCYKSATSLPELSESSTYLSVEDLGDTSEHLEDVIEDDESKTATTIEEGNSAETEIIPRREAKEVEDGPKSLTSRQDYNQIFAWNVQAEEKNSTNHNLENVVEDNRKQNEMQHDLVEDSVNSSKPAGLPNNLNTLQPNTKDINPNHFGDSLKQNAFDMVAADIMVSFFDMGNIGENFTGETIDDNIPQINSNDVGRSEGVIEDDCKQNIATGQLQRPEGFKISVNQQENRAEKTWANSPIIINTAKDNNKIKIREHNSLVKDMVALFNKNSCEKSSGQRNRHGVLDEMNSYPWNLVRQRINQFSKDQDDAMIHGCDKKCQEGISQSLVQQRIQQLLADVNMQKILKFHSSSLIAPQLKERNSQTTGLEKTVQTDFPDIQLSNNNRRFIKNLQLLLSLHERIDESDTDSHSSQFSSDSLESPGIENSPKSLRRSHGVENLSHLEDLESPNSEGCEPEVISSSDDGEEKIYSQFAGYARDQSSPSNTTPNHYETIQESETESTEDYLTPIDVVPSMSQNSAARRHEEISKKFVTNLYESGQRSFDSCVVALKKPADYKIIHSENELHIKNMEVIGDKEHVNYGKLNKQRSSESDNNRISRRVDSVNVGGNNCINVEVPTEFDQEHILVEGSDTECDQNLKQANGEVEMEENIYALAESEGGQEIPKTEDEIYFALKHETDVQGIIMQQATKALELCRNSRNFLAGKELVEAERILLVATRKYESLRNEIQKAKYNDSLKTRNDHALGNITINDLFLPLQLNEADFTRFNYYFILILSHKDTVFSTKVVEGNAMNYANFEDAFTFQGLPSDFVITIDIYGLKVKNLEDKTRLSKKLKTKKKLENLCPKKRLFYKDVQTITLMETSVTQSSFSLCGSVAVTLDDIINNNKSSNNWPIKNASHNINISNTINFNVSISDVRIGGNKKGFLTVGSEVNGHLAWNRRWCVLDGTILKFFNYPSDEDLVDPAVILNFKHCFSGEIEVCDRERCAKSRTMLLKTRTMINGAPESVGHFLSADSRKDLLEWQSRINSIIGALGKWKQLSPDGQV